MLLELQRRFRGPTMFKLSTVEHDLADHSGVPLQLLGLGKARTADKVTRPRTCLLHWEFLLAELRLSLVELELAFGELAQTFGLSSSDFGRPSPRVLGRR